MTDLDKFYLNRWKKNKELTKIGKSKQRRLHNLLRLIEKFNLEKSIKIIDFGCGSGWLMKNLQQLDFKSLHGYDVTPSTLKFILEKYPNLFEIYGLEGKRFDDIPKSYFDLCISSEVYEHIPYSDKEIFIKKLNQIIDNGGFLYLTTPNAKYKKKALEIHKEQPVEDWDTPKKIIHLLNKNGFEILEKGSFYLSPKFSVLHKLLFGYKSTKILKSIGIKKILDSISEKKMLGLSTYFFCKKIT